MPEPRWRRKPSDSEAAWRRSDAWATIRPRRSHAEGLPRLARLLGSSRLLVRRVGLYAERSRRSVNRLGGERVDGERLGVDDVVDARSDWRHDDRYLVRDDGDRDGDRV